MESLAIQVQQLLQSYGDGPYIVNTTNAESGNLAQTSGDIHALATLFKFRFIMDSGATDHMCTAPNIPSDIATTALHAPVTVSNGGQVPIQGVEKNWLFFQKNLMLYLFHNYPLI